MKPIKVKIENGVIKEGSGRLGEILDLIGDRQAYLTIEPVDDLKNEADYRGVYFLFRDVLWDGDNRGYSKKEFHDVLKNHCLLSLLDDKENFSCPPTLSVKCLSLIGWKRFLEAVKEFGKNEFNIYL